MGSINEIVLFETDDKEVTLSVPMDGDTVWLTQEQMSSLFDTARSSIAYHIGNIFKEGELEKNTSVEIFDRSTNNASRPPKYYNLDVIISVGYRVKSKRGIEFRQWASKILKQYMIDGYALLRDGNKRIGDGELVAITLMIAESNPEEKDVMVKLVMNLLNM